MSRIFDFVLRRSWWVVAIFLLFSVFMGIGVSRLKIHYSIGTFYPQESPIVKLLRHVQSTFNTGETEIVVLYADNIFTPKKLRELRRLTDRIKNLKGVIRVASLTNTPRMSEEDGFLVTSDMVPNNHPTPEDIAAIKKYLATNYAMKDGFFVSKDGTSATLIVQFDRKLDERAITAEINTVVKHNWKGRFEATGVPVLGSAIFAIIEKVPMIASIALLVILLFLALNFRSVLGVVLPLVQLLIGLTWGVGFLGWKGDSFLVLMAIAPIAILAVGSSFSLHLLGRYFLELSLGRNKKDAIRTMVTETGLGVFVSGLAISASMLTFLLSELEMIRGMGLLTAAGVFSCMIVALYLLPALLTILPTPKIRKNTFGTRGLSVPLGRLGSSVAAHPRIVLATGIALVLISIVGIFRIVPDTSIAAYFPANSPAIRGMRAVEKALGGSMQVSMLVKGDLKDPKLLDSMLRFQEEARSIPGVGPTQSIATMVRTINETLTGKPAMPATHNLVAQELLLYESSASVNDITSLVNLNYTEGLVTIIVKQESSHDTRIMLSRLQDLAKRTIGNKATVSFTGESLIMLVLEKILLKDFVVSLTLALVLVVLIDSLVRSVRAALVTITVLIFTIALQYGVLGIFGLTFTLATALMGALAIGVGDYAIHLTVRYMEDRRRGLTPEQSVASSIATSGRSILFTSLTLGGGFAALSFSEFAPVAVLGRLMVFTVFAVGIASLTLLPAACVLFFRNPVSRMEVHT